jgi:hypothetical protein
MMRHEQSEQRVFGKPIPWATLAATVPAVVIAAGGAGVLVRLGFARGFGLSVDDVTASQTTLVATVALEGAPALLLAAFSYLAWRIGVQVSAGLQRTRRVTRWLRCRGFVAGSVRDRTRRCSSRRLLAGSVDPAGPGRSAGMDDRVRVARRLARGPCYWSPRPYRCSACSTCTRSARRRPPSCGPTARSTTTGSGRSSCGRAWPTSDSATLRGIP